MSGPATPNEPLSQLLDFAVPGSPLPFNVLDGLGRLLLAAGQRVLDDDQLAALLARDACVDPEEARAARAARAALAPGGQAASDAAGTGGGPQAAGEASGVTPPRNWFELVEKQVWRLDDLLRGLTRGSTKAAQLEAFADSHIALMERHPDAAVFICVRQNDRRFALYALTHALHTATVALFTARQLGWAQETQRQVVLAALTMNASIVELQARMAEQTEPPSKKQLEQIRAHPQQSAALLRAAGVQDDVWLAAVEDHHERADGSGYPRGAVQVGTIAALVRAADVFTAKISPRALRQALSPQLAARQLFQEEQGGPVAAGLIRTVGVYPPGDFVTLKNGEVGIVAHRALLPRGVVVVAIFGANGKIVPGVPRRDTALPEFAITGALADRSRMPRVLPEQVYGVLE